MQEMEAILLHLILNNPRIYIVVISQNGLKYFASHANPDESSLVIRVLKQNI